MNMDTPKLEEYDYELLKRLATKRIYFWGPVPEGHQSYEQQERFITAIHGLIDRQYAHAVPDYSNAPYPVDEYAITEAGRAALAKASGDGGTDPT